ncbi:exodeoxyribonuclease VII large subunit [Legionella sp. W05-934-2]|jgi:exodeoxyribonuclease VII large subunit|uniref:exodeoxyribonuclease VII large subunit n=1 Tax=Legionella sp. W05-934-2 TaxID=1198649 RepID=UPI0034633350
MHPIFTVSELNRQAKQWLEQGFANIKVKGEISNLARPASQHLYFTLKDDSAQIKCAYFRQSQNGWSKNIDNGQSVILLGRVTLYEARGDYQLIVSEVIPDGEGLLLQKIELLKQKLNQEGLFDPTNKQAIPKRPQTIAIITSDSGAAIHDILTTLKKRYPIASVSLYCCEVQGAQAPLTIIRSLKCAISDSRNDVIIIARGGGSLEDLMPFNDEQLAREIYRCPIPVISGVGHETDVTICDFVADLRAATPTAAAQACCPDQSVLLEDISNRIDRMKHLVRQLVAGYQQALGWQTRQLFAPTNLMFNQRWQTLDYLQMRLQQAQKRQLLNKKNSITIQLQHIHKLHPKQIIKSYQHQFSFKLHRLQQIMGITLNAKKQHYGNTTATLHALSPLATLNRGYAIASFNGAIITDPSQVEDSDMIDIRIKHGQLSCKIIQRKKFNE